MQQNSQETPVGEIEEVVERYWLDGMSLEQARRRAVEEQDSAEGIRRQLH